MKKIVSNILIVSTQLIIGGLFLFMLFSDSNENNEVVVVENDNLNKMADAVSELFVADQLENKTIDTTEVDLVSEEERKAQEQAEAEARAKAEEEARIKAEQEAAAKAQAEEEARKKAEEEARNAVIASANGYVSKPAAGFNVTTGNKIYSLSENEIAIVAGVVACEGTTRDDMLGVMSVILNRADACWGGNCTPVSVVAAPSQFSCYGHSATSGAISVVKDALAGIRNTKYTSFNGWSSGVSNNYIVSGGNRYY